MAKTADEKRRSDVEAAIRSLYDLFPTTNTYPYGHPKNKTIVDLKKKIAARKEELENDPIVTRLNKQLKEEQGRVAAYAREKRRKVDEILRRFRLRGESETLLREIESLAKAEPVVLSNDD